jgi:hypothetical protein
VGRYTQVFVGPCAEWLVPRERTSADVDDNPLLEELKQILGFVCSEGELPVVTREGEEFVRFTFYPAELRGKHPRRDLSYTNAGSLDWDVTAVELSDVDRAAEVRWFASAYKAELRQLTAHFKSEPRLNWSLHVWA